MARKRKQPKKDLELTPEQIDQLRESLDRVSASDLYGIAYTCLLRAGEKSDKTGLPVDPTVDATAYAYVVAWEAFMDSLGEPSDEGAPS